MKHAHTQIINDLKKVTKQSGIFFGGSFIELFLRYLYSLILARALGAAQVGVYFLGFTIVSFASLISKLGMQEGVLKFVSSFRSAGNKGNIKGVIFSAAKITVLVSILVCGLMLVLANTFAYKIFKEPLLAKVIVSFLISIPLISLLPIPLSYFQANMKMKYYVLVNSIMQPSVNMLVFIAIFFFGGRLLGAVFSYAVSIALSLFLAIYFLYKSFKFFDRNIRPVPQDRMLLKFSLPLVPAAMLYFGIQWTDTVLLGYFRGAMDVGIYGIAVRTASICSVFFVAFVAASAPVLSDFYERKKMESLEILFKLMTKWIVTLTLPLLLLIVLFSGDILGIFGREFLTGKGALAILCLGQLFNIGTGSVYYIILMIGRSKVVLINAAIVCLLNLILDLMLIPGYGFHGAAIANTCSLIVFNVIMLVEVYYFLRIHPYNFKFIKPVVAAGFSVAIFYLFRGVFSTICLGMLFVACYVAALCLLKLDNENKLVLVLLKEKFLLQKKAHD